MAGDNGTDRRKSGGIKEVFMENIMKNIAREEVLRLAEQVNAQTGQVVSKTIVQNSAVSVTIFAFDKGEEIGTHASHGDAMVTVLDGTAKITIDGKEYLVSSGETILMPAGKPHAVYAQEIMKMLLVVVFTVHQFI